MAHVQKATRGSVGGLTRHYERYKKENGEYISFKNQEIDIKKTHLNYDLAVHQKLSQLDFIKKRTSEVYCLDRKDVNLMVSWVVTKPKDITEKEQELFFQETYNFLENRYGKDNVISSYVHLDETTPHLHFAFIPIIYDQKKNREKVSAKEIVNKRDLQKFHNDLNNHMQNIFHRDIGILNDVTKDGNKSVQELKEEEIKKAKIEAQKIIDSANEKSQLFIDSLEPLRIEYNSKKKYIESYDKSSDISMMYPEYAKVNKTIFGKEMVTVPKEKWEEKHISVNEKGDLKKATKFFEDSIKNLKDNMAYKKIKEQEEEIKELKNNSIDLFYENRDLKNQIKYLSEKQEDIEYKFLKKINKILDELPEEQVKQFVEKWNIEETIKQQSKTKNKSFEIEL